ncbi:unnamed protein product, partial [Adineta steineri]
MPNDATREALQFSDF